MKEKACLAIRNAEMSTCGTFVQLATPCERITCSKRERNRIDDDEKRATKERVYLAACEPKYLNSSKITCSSKDQQRP